MSKFEQNPFPLGYFLPKFILPLFLNYPLQIFDKCPKKGRRIREKLGDALNSNGATKLARDKRKQSRKLSVFSPFFGETRGHGLLARLNSRLKSRANYAAVTRWRLGGSNESTR